MGRPAKYLTHEERLEARRARRAERYRDPAVAQARVRENQRAYIKRRLHLNASIPVPNDVRATASSPLPFEDSSTIAKFRRGPEILCLKHSAIEDGDLELLSRPPLCQGSILVGVSFQDDWHSLGAALYGYQIRKYLDRQETQRSAYSTPDSKLAVSSGLVQDFHCLLVQWDLFKNAEAWFWKEKRLLEAYVARANAYWVAQRIVFANQDLLALAKGDDSYLHVSWERRMRFLDLFP